MRNAKPKGAKVDVVALAELAQRAGLGSEIPGYLPCVPKVEVVSTNATKLIEVGPRSPVWEHGRAGINGGEIVKLQPPPDATDAMVKAVVDSLTAQGAHHVRVLPRQRAAAQPKAEPRARAHRDLRGAVMAVVDASRAPDKAALRAEVEAALAAEGI